MVLLFLLPILVSATGETDLRISTLAQGDTSGITTATRIVIRSGEAWQTLWTQHAMESPSDLPAVDFSRETVLVVFAGERQTGGYQVEITAVEAKDDGALVTYREIEPAPGSFLTQQLTHPYHFVTIPRVDGPIVFRRE